MTPLLRHALLLASLAALVPGDAARAQEPRESTEARTAAAADEAGGPATPAEPGLAESGAALDARRGEAYERFRALVAEGRYAEAVPLAREVLQLTEQLDPDHAELPTAYNNLGVAELRAGDPRAALVSFGKALDLLESSKGIGSRRLIAPMAGLGAAYNALGEPALAAEQLERAIAVSRRAAGLFNLEQLELMDALIRAYAAVGFTEGIDRERRYAVQVVEKRFGAGDPRALPRLNELAEWYEATGRYAAARLFYRRALDIASRESGGRSPATVNALLAIARTHRLQFAEDPESLVEAQDPMPLTGESLAAARARATAPVPATMQPQTAIRLRLDPEGRKALDQALSLLESSSDPPDALMSRTLLEHGDWFMTSGSTAEALSYYERAWPLLESLARADGAANPLAAPRRLLYRAPAGQRRSRLLAGNEIVELRGDFLVDVDANGQPVSAEAAGGNLSEIQSSQVLRALRRAIFSPAHADGRPVATTGYRLSETWFEFARDYEERAGGADASPAPSSPEGGSPTGAGSPGEAPDSGGTPPGGPEGDAGDSPVAGDVDDAAGADGAPAAEPPPGS
ncbi:MAG: tetratricopeptide repeat protein [Steroidobacteraceae bacterium]|jgi:tetratricopeptide (TPR) repeat protein|nr:tetratricopeptide repeat protein [Steroidobacteraceae bacterium]